MLTQWQGLDGDMMTIQLNRNDLSLATVTVRRRGERTQRIAIRTVRGARARARHRPLASGRPSQTELSAPTAVSAAFDRPFAPPSARRPPPHHPPTRANRIRRPCQEEKTDYNNPLHSPLRANGLIYPFVICCVHLFVIFMCSSAIHSMC